MCILQKVDIMEAYILVCGGYVLVVLVVRNM